MKKCKVMISDGVPMRERVGRSGSANVHWVYRSINATFDEVVPSPPKGSVSAHGRYWSSREPGYGGESWPFNSNRWRLDLAYRKRVLEAINDEEGFFADNWRRAALALHMVLVLYSKYGSQPPAELDRRGVGTYSTGWIDMDGYFSILKLKAGIASEVMPATPPFFDGKPHAAVLKGRPWPDVVIPWIYF